MDYDTWLTSEPDSDLFCPQCMCPILNYEWDADEGVGMAFCECGWSGIEQQLMHEWEVAEEYAIMRGEQMYDEMREGL